MLLSQSCTLDATVCHFAFLLLMQPYKYAVVSGLGVLQVIIIFVRQHPQSSLSEQGVNEKGACITFLLSYSLNSDDGAALRSCKC